MTELEWLAYLDKLAALERPSGAEIAETFGALLERISTVIIAYANRQHDDIQQLERRLADLRSREREAGG
jgi:hypothetical protein